MMRRAIVIFLVVLLMSGGLLTAVAMGATGYGMVSPGGPSARVGSVGGVYIVGGGPGSGK